MEATILPVTIFRSEATKIRVDVVQVRSLGESGSAIAVCSLLDDAGNNLRNEAVDISGQDYAQWGSDDSYILDKAIELLGLTRAPQSND